MDLVPAIVIKKEDANCLIQTLQLTFCEMVSSLSSAVEVGVSFFNFPSAFIASVLASEISDLTSSCMERWQRARRDFIWKQTSNKF